jgi:hypothetical protein
MPQVDEIAALLEQADTPRDRAMLLVLYKLVSKLSEVDARTTQHAIDFNNHREEFRLHVSQEETLLNRLIGIWISLILLGSGMLTLGGWYVSHYIIDVNQAQQQSIDINSNRLTALETLIRQILEKRQ